MNLLVIATVSLFFAAATPFPQSETTVKPENGAVADNKSLNETQPEVPAPPSHVNGTALPPPPPPPPSSPPPAANGKKPEPEFGPEARSDSPRGRPKINFKGKPLSKPFSKAQRKKLTEVQKKPFNPLPAARRKRPVAPVPAAKVSKVPPKPVERVSLPKPVSQPKPVESVKARVDKAQRRDHSPSYGLPPVFGNEVIIKQAGPSQEYGWVGHGRNGPLNLPNPFPASLPKWILENNKIFEAGLLYPGAPSSAPSYAPPPPPPPAQPVYEPAPAAPVYSEPTSYNVPQIPISSSYNSVDQQPIYNEAPQTYVVPEEPIGTYGAASLPAYTEVQQAPTNYGIVPAGANYGSAVVSASYSSVDTAQGSYQAPSEYAAAVPATYAEPFSGYVAATPQESYNAPTDFRSAAPAYEVPAAYGSPQPLETYEAPVSYGAPQAVESYEAPAAYGVPQAVESYQAPAAYGVPQAVESYEAPATYGVPQAVESYEVPAAYGAPQAVESYVAPEEVPAAAPLPTYNNQPVPVDYNVPAPDDQSLYNLYKSPVQQQPSYQEVADNSYSVPSVSRPGNFPAYNEELAQPLDTQDIYDVPIKVEETYQNQGDSKTPEVFYIFYENQEPTAAAQNEQSYVVAPPENNGFVPPKDIQTIYVPAENAINIPENFGVDVGSSFGYSSPDSVIPEYDEIQPSANGFSFDNPAFNPPPRPITETLFRGSVENGLKDPIIKDDVQNPIQPRNPLRPIRQLLKKPLSTSNEDLSLESLSLLRDDSLPYGTRLRVSQD